ncbi:iron-containing alcohol dehydrogenase family protein [Hydrogenophaga sp.]|uniref:iron-containing alcohol dehydrogenase family protein n=1 Tax=Hydrogenophaga sp. TaxID=1904254 RepID=UPI002716ECA6|nr:iron-containing alcohol dehydrogenase family protein [Hydrogenophaga sp.]MDO9435944.1 iron-containing alcohol dehydrogenase family protein [Hydrogenophaga sp.]
MRSFELSIPAMRLHSGAGSLQKVSAELRRLGCQRAVIFCGGSLSRHPTLLLELRNSLGNAYAGTFDRVRAHSPTDVVMEAAQMLRECGADAAIAVGGGSAIVTARAASIVLAEGRTPRELCTVRGDDGRLTSPRLLAPKIPQLVVPSTPTTATPKAGTAVHDSVTGERLAMFDPKTRASCIFVDPALLATAPMELFRSASLNAIAMAVSGLEADRESPMAVGLLRHALLLLAKWLPRLVSRADDAEARIQLVHAAILCGQGTDLTGGGIVTALGHSLGTKVDVDNGIVNAVLLRHTMQFNAKATGSRHAHVLSALQEAAGFQTAGTDAVGAMQSLLESIDAPTSLRAIGLGREIFDAVATHAMMDWSLGNNPREVTHEAILQVLEAAW